VKVVVVPAGDERRGAAVSVVLDGTDQPRWSTTSTSPTGGTLRSGWAGRASAISTASETAGRCADG